MLLLAALFTAVVAGGPQHAVVLLIDDLGYGDTHHMGAEYPTPNIDVSNLLFVSFPIPYSASPTVGHYMCAYHTAHSIVDAYHFAVAFVREGTGSWRVCQRSTLLLPPAHMCSRNE